MLGALVIRRLSLQGSSVVSVTCQLVGSRASSTATSIQPEQVRFYQENGWCVPSFQLSPDTLKEQRVALERLLAANPNVRPDALVNAHLSDGSGGAVRGENDFLTLGASRALSEIAGAVMQTSDVLLWACHIFCKVGGGREVPYHQDGQFWPIAPLRATTLWVALDDSDTGNGCLQVLPGSHKVGELPHESSGHDKALDLTIEGKALQGLGLPVNPIELKAGQLSAHDAMIVHGSHGNQSTRRRAGIAYHYMDANSEFLRDDAKSTQSASRSFGYETRPLIWVCGSDIHPSNTLVRDMRDTSSE